MLTHDKGLETRTEIKKRIEQKIVKRLKKIGKEKRGKIREL